MGSSSEDLVASTQSTTTTATTTTMTSGSNRFRVNFLLEARESAVLVLFPLCRSLVAAGFSS